MYDQFDLQRLDERQRRSGVPSKPPSDGVSLYGSLAMLAVVAVVLLGVFWIGGF